ncbi:MAG: aspartate aminotransferase family protein [Betaproteobacteria bacterium]|nr:aspartate aminotransferase family protein [Betaproteobacteria bacterium]
MSKVFPRDTRNPPPRAVRGDGVYLYDSEGRRWLDGCGGAAVSCLGHSPRAVIEAAKAQLDALPWAHTGFFTCDAAEQLAAALAARAPAEIERAYFAGGGSEAVETAIKLARQYFVERGEPRRANIIARRQSYHGATLGALGIGGHAKRREHFLPFFSGAAHHIAPCHYWRFGEDEETAEEYARRAAAELEQKIAELGAETVVAFIAETVAGATLGAVAAEKGYFQRVREICNRHGVLLILDEVMCGMGRTGALFACETERIAPDIICLAKGLGAGVQPIGAALCTEEIYQTIKNGSGIFRHGHTYIGHAAACAAALAALGEIEKLLPNVRALGEKLRENLQNTLGAHPHVADIRGRGMFIGVEFTQSGKTPFAAEKKIYAAVQRAAFAEGLMVYGGGGTADGKKGDHILIAPPFIFEEKHIAELTEKLSRALKIVF